MDLKVERDCVNLSHFGDFKKLGQINERNDGQSYTLDPFSVPSPGPVLISLIHTYFHYMPVPHMMTLPSLLFQGSCQCSTWPQPPHCWLESIIRVVIHRHTPSIALCG